MHPSVELLWSRYRAGHPAAPSAVPTSFHFCDNREDADLCAELVVAGRKRATAASVAELELSGDPVPRVGDYAIVTDWTGRAKAIIRTTSVEIKRFGDVHEDFARMEGEGDLSLQWWRTAHRAYFRRMLAGSDYRVDDELEIVCEKFELVLADV
jgi:uncharacterized protein YhfF